MASCYQAHGHRAIRRKLSCYQAQLSIVLSAVNHRAIRRTQTAKSKKIQALLAPLNDLTILVLISLTL
jgi:hypothetical protein